MMSVGLSAAYGQKRYDSQQDRQCVFHDSLLMRARIPDHELRTAAPSRLVRSMALRSLFFVAETLVSCLDKHVGCPVPGSAAIDRIIVFCWPRSLHLLESHASFNHLLQAVSDDGHHLLVHSQIGAITQSSMPGDDH